MKKSSFITVVMFILFSVTSVAIAGPPGPPCPPDTTCLDNHMAPIAQIGSAAEARKIKKIEIITFSEFLWKTPDDAFYKAMKKARKWLGSQNADTIISQSQAVFCSNEQGTCDAFITIMYWQMVDLITVKK